jgi:hypothetical protein
MNDAKALRDRGIETAIDHADRVVAGWSDAAFEELCAFTHLIGLTARFTSEDVRLFADARGFAKPPDNRAWGSVMLRASKRGLIKKVGWTTANDPKVHCNPVSLWEVNSSTT